MSVSVPTIRAGVPSGFQSTVLPRLRIQIQWPSACRSRYSVTLKPRSPVPWRSTSDRMRPRSSGWMRAIHSWGVSS